MARRVPVLISPEEKVRLAKKAKAAGLTIAEYMRQAAVAYQPDPEEAALSAALDEMLAATARAEQVIDDTLDFIEASNRRIAEMEDRQKVA